MKIEIKNEFNLNNLSEDELCYIKNRLLPQIEWYNNKAENMQKYYKIMSIISFSLSALIPFIVLFNDDFFTKIITSLIGVTISIINYIINIQEYKDLWLKYRSSCEILKSQLHIYLNSNQINKEEFICQCERYFTDEFTSWYNSKKSNNSFSTNS